LRHAQDVSDNPQRPIAGDHADADLQRDRERRRLSAINASNEAKT
jgi:hypothetical protein